MGTSSLTSIDLDDYAILAGNGSAGFEADQSSEKQLSKGRPPASALGRHRNTHLPDITSTETGRPKSTTSIIRPNMPCSRYYL